MSLWRISLCCSCYFKQNIFTATVCCTYIYEWAKSITYCSCEPRAAPWDSKVPPLIEWQLVRCSSVNVNQYDQFHSSRSPYCAHIPKRTFTFTFEEPSVKITLMMSSELSLLQIKYSLHELVAWSLKDVGFMCHGWSNKTGHQVASWEVWDSAFWPICYSNLSQSVGCGPLVICESPTSGPQVDLVKYHSNLQSLVVSGIDGLLFTSNQCLCKFKRCILKLAVLLRRQTVM